MYSGQSFGFDLLDQLFDLSVFGFYDFLQFGEL